MATFYIDPSAAVNGSGTEASPYNVIPGTLVAGNEYLYKRGTTFTPGAQTQAIQVGQGGSSESARVVVGAYGTGERPIIRGTNTTRGINIGSTDIGYITIQDLHIDNVAANTSRRGITNNVTAPKTVNTSIILQRLKITNVVTDGANDCNAISLRGANNIIRDCEIEDIADDGIWYHGDNIRIERNTIQRVAQSGRVAGDCIQCGGASDNGRIVRNTLDHSNVGPKQCYIHNTASTGLLFERNYCIGFPDATFTTVYIDAIDAAIIRWNTCVGGANLHILAKSASGQVYGNYCENDFGRAIDIAASNAAVQGNTCVGAGLASVYGIRHTDAALTGITIQNNLLIGWDRGIQATTGASASHNGFWQNTTNINGITSGGGDITADPLLTFDYKPMPGSPLLGAGTHLGYTRDIERKQRPNPPSIGAYDYATLRTP